MIMIHILFFNGWGMDNNAVKNMDLPVKFQLHILNYPYEMPINLDFSKGTWIGIGWSFGAYYLNKFVLEHPEIEFAQIIAINGSGAMVGPGGINPRMLDLTINTLTKDSLLSFYDNMGLPRDLGNITRAFEDINQELIYFKEHYKELENVFTKVFISDKDRIVPAKAQERYFNKFPKSRQVKLSAPHFPFQVLNNWQSIIEG